MSLDPTAFPRWMQAVHGHAPFPWQQRLLEHVLEHGWPSTLRLPTSSGKTTAMDVALFAVACQLHRGGERTMPLRIAFVVDRRIVVDAAYERAVRIRGALEAARDDIVGAVATALSSLGTPEPLHVALLRGGIYREDRWARLPNQPTIVCSTVDQVGSRLLHRGYGVSARTWPIHAGLLGNDALVLLDEAHRSAAFHKTLTSVAELRERAHRPLGAPWFATSMTATPRDDQAPFELGADDREHPVLRRRLEARKSLVRESCEARTDGAFAVALVDEVVRRWVSGSTALVVANRVATARAALEELAKRCRKRKLHADLLLLTGRTRSIDRDALIDAHRSRLLAGRERAADGHRPGLIVVATQCIEVGADLDVDLLVTEACPLDAFRQRLGRLDRLGTLGETSCVIVARREQAWDGTGAPVPDPVYGEAVGRTWRWLADQEQRTPLDGGILAFSTCAEGHPPELDAPVADAPTVMPAYCDLWAQTGPAPAKSPEPALFLHGRQTSLPEVQLVWRADLDQNEPGRWAEIVSLCPPVVGETLPLRLDVARRWLSGLLGQDLTADVDVLVAPEPDKDGEAIMRPVLRWRGPHSELAREPGAIAPGDTLIVPATYGGCDRFGWSPTDAGPVSDRADAARAQARRAPAIRLVRSTLPDDAPQPVCDLAELPSLDVPDDIVERVRAALSEWAEVGNGLPQETSRALLADRGLRIEPHPAGHGFVVIGRAGWALDARDFSDEDETSSCAPAEVALDQHLGDVREVARQLAAAVGLSSDLQEDVALAGYLHDLGKADPRFQAWLREGNRIAALRGPVLAKSPRMPPSLVASRLARERAGYPAGGRHELLSVRLAESDPDVLANAHDRDLVLHLVESHHGHCRPFAPVVHDEVPVQVEHRLDGRVLSASSATGLEGLDAGPAQRFFALLRRYGWWGLSYLEAIMRLADHRASESAVGRAR